jgi:hypothetical protein
MGIRVSQKVVYAATAAIVLSMIGGFAMASLSLGGTNTNYQGSQTTTVASVAGLTWTSTNLEELSAAVTNTTCSSGSPCSVTSAGATDCIGGFTSPVACASGDFVEAVTLTTIAGTAFPGTVQVTVYVTGTSGTVAGTTFYYTQTSTSNTAQTIVQYFDVGTASSGPGMVSTVSVVASG